MSVTRNKQSSNPPELNQAMTKYRIDQTTQLSLAAIFALWFVFCQPWFFDKLIIPNDAKNHFYAMVRFVANAWHNGESAFWSPYHYAGFPMLADPQSTLLTPSLWLPALLSSKPSFYLVDAIELFHLLIIGITLFAFGRARGWIASASMVAAIAAMMGGVIAIRLEHVLMIVTMMWLSVALWRLDALLRFGGWWRGFLFGLPLGLMLLNRDHVAYLGAWFLLAFWLCEIAPQFKAEGAKKTCFKQWPVIMGGGIALIMIAVPILLLLQLAQHSNRPAFDLQLASWQSLHPAALISVFWPDYFGSPRLFGDYWGPGGAHWGGEDLKMHRGMMHLYQGILPLVLVFYYGLLRRRVSAPDVRFYLAIALCALLYSLGRYTPVFAYLYEFIPGVSLFRRPADGLFIFGLAVSLMSGALLHDVLSRPARQSTKLTELLFIATTALILYISVIMAVEREKFSYFLNTFGVFIILAALIMGLLYLAKHHPKARPIALGALLLVVSFDLIHHLSGIKGNARPVDFYEAQAAPEREPVFAKLQKLLEAEDPSGAPWRVEILGLGPAMQNIAQIAPFHNLLGYNPIRLKSFSDHLAPNMEYSANTKRRFGDLMTGYDTSATDQLGIKYLVTGAPIETIDAGLSPDRFELLDIIPYGRYTAHIYENTQAEPRALIITEGGATASNAATIITYGNTEIRVAIKSSESGQLVLRDFVYPGWQAEVNGVGVPIETHEKLFRSVTIPRGQSEVIFKFRPLSFDNLKNAARDLLAKTN